MKRDKLKQFREKNIPELEAEIVKLRKEIQEKLLEKEAGKLKNINQVRKLKKDLSQLLTITRMIELTGE